MKDYGEDLQIGIAPNPFKGQLAEVRIWNVARTADQILPTWIRQFRLMERFWFGPALTTLQN